MANTKVQTEQLADDAVTSAKLGGDLTAPGHIRFADNKKTIFGAGDDLHIYHDGSHNYIDVSTSDQDLIIKGTDGGSDITAITIDMSEAGAATFNNSINSVTNKIVNTNGYFAANLAECDDPRMALLISPTRSTVTDAITLGRMTNHSGIQGHDTSDDTAQNFLINPYGGNVGINITSPTAILSLPAQASGGNGVARLAIESAVDSNDFTIAQYEDSSGTYTQIGQNISLTSGGNVAVLDSGHKTAGINFDGRGSGSLQFLTGGTGSNFERMRISDDGNIGMGMNDPDNMHPNAHNLVVGTGSGDQGMTIFAGTSTGRYAFARATGITTDTYDGGMSYDGNRNLMFHTNAGATRMTINSSGRVGIGTNTNVSGSAMTYPITINSNVASGSAIEVHRTANSHGYWYASTAGSHYLDAYGTTPLWKIRIAGTDILDFKAAGLEGATLWASTNEITSTMDNLKRTGFYRIQNNAGGQPISATYGAAVVFGNQSNVTTQIWSPLQSSTLYVRSFNSSWSSWTQL